MKKIKILSIALVGVLLLALFVACNANNDSPTDTDDKAKYASLPEYDTEKLSEYIEPFEYTGLTVTVKEGQSRSEAIFESISSGANVKKYPTPQIEYYVSQEKAKYKYLAERDGIEYDRLLEGLGVDDKTMKESAEKMVKDDLVLAFIIKDAGITLSDTEKEEHTDRYAEKLTELYGYNKDYIKKNMTEQIYETMLYDKTMEYLILNNTVA